MSGNNKVEKIFKMTKRDFKNPKKFREKIADYLVKTYNCDRKWADYSISNAFSYDWAICPVLDEGKRGVGLQSNLYRDTLYVGRLTD